MNNKDHQSENSLPDLEFCPLTPDRWSDVEALFGLRGACGGCWCMWWLIPHPQFNRQKGEGNHQAFKQLVQSGRETGILAYAQGKPVGWCALGPREVYAGMESSRVMKRVDDQPVWSVVCFFIARPYRQKGMTQALLLAAVQYAKEHGASILEGYPVEPRIGQSPDPFVFTGLASTFRRLGFVEVARRSETRPIMRYYLT